MIAPGLLVTVIWLPRVAMVAVPLATAAPTGSANTPASATDENYAMGLLWADAESNLLDPRSWTKSDRPVLTSSPAHRIFGPGHNSFTVAEDGVTDLLVYHARTYTEIEGDPLWNPDRHTFVKPLRWDRDGMPVFGDAALAEDPVAA